MGRPLHVPEILAYLRSSPPAAATTIAAALGLKVSAVRNTVTDQVAFDKIHVAAWTRGKGGRINLYAAGPKPPVASYGQDEALAAMQAAAMQHRTFQGARA